MLHRHISQFLDYVKLADFSIRSIQALSARLNEFENFLIIQRIRSVKRVKYSHLIDFAASYRNASLHVTKSRVWALRHLYHFLTLRQIVPENIASSLQYPKIEKTVPQYLTEAEYTLLLGHFADRSDSPMGLRNLIIIMLLGTLGLRTATLTAVNIEHIDLTCGLLWITEKGRRHRSMVLPHCICKVIHNYLQLQVRKKGPLLLSKRKKRISPRTLQDIFRSAADQLGIDKKLHARLFRHTAATQLNKVAGIEITQQVLGHSRRANTLKYVHLNPDQYAGYMKQHPFMRKEPS
jgi:site-specific recombinase XerD